MAKPKVTVVGSMNVDIFLTMFRMPDLGETIASDTMKKAFGGKVSMGNPLDRLSDGATETNLFKSD